MITKLTIAAAAVLAVTPAAVTVFVPSPGGMAMVRSVELATPVIGFTQSPDRIQVRLQPAASDAERDARRQVVIRDEDGDSLMIALKRGQTWASAELPANLASANALVIGVE
jgi:hypothetical protein